MLVVLLLRKGNQNGSDIWILNVFGRSEAPLPLMLRPGNGRVEPTGSEEWDGFVAASLHGFEIEIGKPWGGWDGREESVGRERRHYPSTELEVELGAVVLVELEVLEESAHD